MGEQQGILKENKREKILKKERKNFFFNLTKNIHISLGISLEMLQSVQVQFNFRQLLFSAYTSRYLQAPSGVVGVTFRDFNLLHRSFLKRFPLFIWLLLPSLWCLLSALTQAGGGDLLFGFSVQCSPAAGRAGRCRQMSLCVESTPRVPATLGLPRTGVSVLSPSTLPRLPAVPHGAGPVLSAVPALGYPTKTRIRPRLHLVSSLA